MHNRRYLVLIATSVARLHLSADPYERTDPYGRYRFGVRVYQTTDFDRCVDRNPLP